MFSEGDLDDIIKLLTSQTKVKDLVESYEHFLNVNHSEHIKPFHSRLQNKSESARAEAVVFSFLKENLNHVQLEETLVKGGVDFRCKTDKTEFVVEVTCLDAESVTRTSGLPNETPETGSGRHYSMITPLLLKKRLIKHLRCPNMIALVSL